MRLTMLGDSFLSNLLVDKMDHLAAPKTTVAIVTQGKSLPPVRIDMEISRLLLDVRSEAKNFQNVSYISSGNWSQTTGKGTGTVVKARLCFCAGSSEPAFNDDPTSTVISCVGL